MADGVVLIKTELDTKSFDAEIEATERKLNDMIADYETMSKSKSFKKQSNDAVELRKNIEKLNNKLVSLKQKQSAVNKEGFKEINVSTENVGKSLEKTTKKLSKMALAVFGIRSAYLMVRQAVGTISQYDDKMAANIEYIKWVLAMLIKPIVEWIVKAAYTLLGVIGTIAQNLFGVNIFADKTADAFMRAKKSLSGSNKEARELQKTLAGFDEMTILQKDGSTGIGSGASLTAPTMDLSNFMDNKDVQKIKHFWEDIVDYWEHGWANDFSQLDGQWGAFFAGLLLTVKGAWDMMKGIGEEIYGAFEMLIGVITGDFDKVEEGFNIFLEGIKNAIAGEWEIAAGLLMAILGFIKGILIAIWDFFCDIIIDPIVGFFEGLWNSIKGGIENAITKTKGTFLTVVSWFETYIINPISNLFEKMWDGIKKGAEVVGNALKDFARIIKDIFTKVFDGIKKAYDELKSSINRTTHAYTPTLWDNVTGWFKRTFGFAKGGIVVPKLASGGIINQPGRGVPLTSAIGGERGAEGVIPLTDSQQMTLLGEAIGKYITVNANITTTMNGRVISRELQKVQNDSNFAYNR